MGLTGFVGVVLEVIRAVREGAHVTLVKIDPGSGDAALIDYFGPPGDDSNPLPQDYAFSAPNEETGGSAVLGFADTRNQAQAGPGERRLYARDSSGNVVAWMWFRSDGSIEVQAPSGVTINGVAIDSDGNVDAPEEVTAYAGTPQSVSVSGHIHASGTGPTDSPTPGT